MEVTMDDKNETEDALMAPEPRIEKSAYDMLQQSKASMEEIVGKMLSIKKEAQPKSQLRELVTQMFLHFVVLRQGFDGAQVFKILLTQADVAWNIGLQANRSILLEEDRAKAETERAKTPVDFTTLQLHNLMYEKNHYVKAIKACKDFKSKYPDIELVPEEEFFRDAHEDIKGTVMSNDSAHNLMLKRLNFELFQRKELCKLHEKLEQRKKGLLETIANRKKFLSSLPSHLKSLKKASLPVQQQLGVLHTKKLKQQHSAELLPPPLYVIYSQFTAQKEAFGENIDMEIVGSVKEAQAFARQQANKDSEWYYASEEKAGLFFLQHSVDRNTHIHKSNNSRLEDDAPDEEDDGQRRRKRPKKVPSKENLDQAGVYQVHPLKIILHIYDDEVSDLKSAKLITLKFEYLLKLNVVCVGIEGSHEGPENNILCNLFPDDTGLDLPHQSAKLFIGNARAFDERRTSRPYKWAQHLAGIDFLPEVSPLLTCSETPSSETAKNATVVSGLSLYRQQNRVQTVVQRIRSRKKAQLALVEQLDSLMKLKWPTVSCKSIPWALHTPLCNFNGWSSVGSSPNQASALSVTSKEQVQETLDINMDGKSGTPREEVESAREDGELPSLVPVASVVNEAKLTPSRGSELEHSRRLALISKSIVPPTNKIKSLSFKKHDDDSDLLLDSDSDLDEPAQIEPEAENIASDGCYVMIENSWVDYGVREFCLVLTRKMDAYERNVKLEAKIKISMEYPLRPPLFAISLYTVSPVKVILKLKDRSGTMNCVPWKQSTSVVDVGLCKPVTGRLLARSVRGRDRRKMISWKDMECTPGYPY
ncbi:THO complex subunit 5B [Vitis vinifera]|uniref:THO complex subunit 5B n=1 Tax=Vitis vinifera TaxID=29760 RepID=A0A438ITI0_VITVI|nr:THO complex subunit 5B [Vitis vinifera]